MQYPRVKPQVSKESAAPGVYVVLDDLIRLQFKARGFRFLPKQPVESLLAGRRASRLRGRGLDFEQIRRYVPGDDIRTMDWKVTARTGKPHSRVYTEERDRPALLVVDQRLSMFFGSKTSMKSVTAVEVAALGAWRAFSVGDRIGAVVFNDSDVSEISPHRSRQRVMQILQAMTEMNHALKVDGHIESNPAMLNRALKKVLGVAKHDHIVGIISDFSGADDETRSLVTRLAVHNDVLALFIYDPLESDLPTAGRLTVSEGDLQLEVDTSDADLRKQFSGEFTTGLATARDLMLKRAIPLLPIHTTEEVTEQLWRLFGHGPASLR
jgi:uncharacterized protein (DUF58 family)